MFHRDLFFVKVAKDLFAAQVMAEPLPRQYRAEQQGKADAGLIDLQHPAVNRAIAAASQIVFQAAFFAVTLFFLCNNK